MRQILTQEEISAKEKKRNIIISILLLGIMLMSTLGFAFIYNTGSSSQTNSSIAQNVGNSWAVNYGSTQLLFSNPPTVVNETKADLLISMNQYYNKPLYIDTSSDSVYSEISSTLGLYSERVQHGCYSSCENSNYPQKTCSDNIIIYNPNITNHIYQNNSCVFISGDMRAVDAFLYKVFNL